MKLSGSYQINLEKQKVWKALNDPEILKKSIPGCEDFKKDSETEFTATATNKIGPFNASFTGNIELKEINAPNSYVIEGSGNSPVGFASGEAKVKLEDFEGGTKLIYEVEANVGGKIAQVGSRLIAYHEVGHALVGTLVKDHDPVQKVTVIPRGQAKGLTWFSPDDDQMLVSRAQLKARIMGALGGRAAEDIVFGREEVTTGAGGDIQQVASMARQMVTKFGMSDLGPVALEGDSQEVFLGRDLMTRNDISDAISRQIDEKVREMVKQVKLYFSF